MMRICAECAEAMLDMKMELSERHTIVVRTENNKNVGTIACRVCPKCGNVTLHLNDMTKLTKYLNK